MKLIKGEYQAGVSTVGLWNFLGSSADSSLKGNAGSDTSISYGVFPGFLRGGAKLNGTTSFISIASPTAIPTGSADRTEVLIFTPTAFPAAFGGLTSFGNHGASRNAFEVLLASDGTIYLWLEGADDFQTTKKVTLNARNIVIVTYTGTTVSVLINSNAPETKTISGALSTASTALTFGKDSSGRFVQANLDQYLFENRTWSVAEQKMFIAFTLRYLTHRGTRSFLNGLRNFTKTLSDSIANGASRIATVSRLATYTRTLSDSIMNAASRLATVAKGLTRTLSISFMNASSRFATVTRTFGAVRSLVDSVLNGASRTATVSRSIMFARSLSDAISNGASRFATVARIHGFIRTVSDSMMAAKGRLTTVKAFVNNVLIQFKSKYVTQFRLRGFGGIVYQEKYEARGTTFDEKYQKQNTDFENKYQ